MKGWMDLRNSQKKISFHSLSFNTHQNETPTPTSIKKKYLLNMHVSIRIYLFIHIYVEGSRDPATMGCSWTQRTHTRQPRGVPSYCVLRQLYS